MAARRSLLTVLFTDIVGSTSLVESLGDRRWGDLLADHFAATRGAVSACRGQEIRTVGDGMVAVFHSPGDAIDCGLRAVGAARALGLDLRVGIHTGEMELTDDDLVGVGVHVGARIGALAQAREVLVSATVKELARGGEYVFEARGSHNLKGVTGKYRLYAAQPGKATESPEGRPVGPGLPRVLLVDDHPLWRQTLRSILETSGKADVVGEAGDGRQAVELAGQLQPDLVLMDIELPILTGIESTREIVRARPDSRVLILSSNSDEPTVLASVRAGASGYLLKTAGAGEVLATIRRITQGEVVFPSQLTAVVLRALRSDAGGDKAGLDDLSPRERDVLELMARGLTNQAIAADLHVGIKTVETHVATIFSKLAIDGQDQHRRVMAVLAYLRESGAGSAAE